MPIAFPNISLAFFFRCFALLEKAFFWSRECFFSHKIRESLLKNLASSYQNCLFRVYFETLNFEKLSETQRRTMLQKEKKKNAH